MMYQTLVPLLKEGKITTEQWALMLQGCLETIKPHLEEIVISWFDELGCLDNNSDFFEKLSAHSMKSIDANILSEKGLTFYVNDGSHRARSLERTITTWGLSTKRHWVIIRVKVGRVLDGSERLREVDIQPVTVESMLKETGISPLLILSHIDSAVAAWKNRSAVAFERISGIAFQVQMASQIALNRATLPELT